MTEVQQIEELRLQGRKVTGTESRSRLRDAKFDFLKGFLVLVMVGHHSLLYLSEGRHPFIKYFDFVTGGFVFASGFLASFLSQSRSTSKLVEVSLRLLQRGGKIILLFLAANLVINLVARTNHNGKSFGLAQFIGNLGNIFWEGRKLLVTFPILLPIAYTLFLLAFLVLIPHRRLVAVILALGLLVFCNWSSDAPFNIYYLSMGVTGVALGMLSDPRLLAFVVQKWPRITLLAGALAYMGLIALLRRDNVLIYAAGIISILGTVYGFVANLEYRGWLFRYVVIIGQYSLLAYVMHILFFQVLYRFGPRPFLVRTQGAVSFLLASAFLAALCYGLDFLRWRDDRINACYRAVFS